MEDTTVLGISEALKKSTAPDSATGIDSDMEKSLDRLLLANRTRELGDYPQPVSVSDLGRISWLFRGIAKLAYGAVGDSPSERPGLLKRIKFGLLDASVLVLVRILLNRRKVWRAGSGTVGTVVRNVVTPGGRYHKKSTSEITGYVTTTDREEPLIRVCLMLRVMKRYGACIEFLIQRLRSGLPATETRNWLSFFLAEIHDKRASTLISQSDGRFDTTQSWPLQAHVRESLSDSGKRSKLKFGVVLPTMFDSDVFHSSLLSLLNSDFPGEIVVVEEGNRPEKVCEAFCSRLPVTYVKHSTWNGTCGVANLGIETMSPDTDVIIFAHSDLLWPPRWFEPLEQAWDKVFDSGKVGTIHLGVSEFYRASDTVLGELFLQGKYDELIWILGAMRESPRTMGLFPAVQMNDKNRGKQFGLSMSHWHEGVPGFFVGDSVLASFPRQIWSDLDGFDVSLGVGVGGEVAYYNMMNRKWGLSINNTPIIHFAKTDTDGGNLNPEDKAELDRIFNLFHDRFEEKYGWDYAHLYHTYHGETLTVHCDEITAAVNDLRFSDVDYLFDAFFERLNHKTLSECELTACPRRTNCKYV